MAKNRTFGQMPEGAQDEIAEMLTDSFYESEPLAQLVHDYLVKNQPNPMSVVFAGMLIDKMMTEMVPDGKWPEMKKFGVASWKTMDENGILGELKRL